MINLQIIGITVNIMIIILGFIGLYFTNKLLAFQARRER